MSSATRSRGRRPASILTNILVLMTLSTTVLLVAFAAFHLSAASRAQRKDHEQYISTTLHFIRAELEETLDEGQPERAELEEIEDSIVRENASRILGRLFVEILDPGGQVLLRTRGADDVMEQMPPFPPPAGGATTPTIEYWEGKNGTQYVLSSLATTATDGRLRFVRLALDWTALEQETEAFRRESSAAILVCSLLAAVAAALVARHALRPLRVIRDAAESIRSGSFDARLEPERLPSELSALAESFARMQEHLRESFERLSQFSAELAHEMRTPVNNLMGETEVALSKPRTAEEYREALESTLEESVRLSRMIDSLLFLARASRSSAMLDIEQLDLASEVESVAEYHRAQAEDVGAKVIVEGTASLSGDRTLLRRALSNILSNALEASSAGGTVSISISESSEGVEIAVQDEGTGITAEDLPAVFERFHRSHGARMRRPEGSGLGLSIVKSIVERHGGAASIESRSGNGTRVRLVFPSGRA